MIFTGAVKIFAYSEPTDMRKSFQGLCALVTNSMGQDPLSGSFYIFRNKKKDKLKLLYWDQSGFAIWYKQLQEGKFNFPESNGVCLEIDSSLMSLILEGIEISSAKRQKRFKLGRRSEQFLS
jgi:transposase